MSAKSTEESGAPSTPPSSVGGESEVAVLRGQLAAVVERYRALQAKYQALEAERPNQSAKGDVISEALDARVDSLRERAKQLQERERTQQKQFAETELRLTEEGQRLKAAKDLLQRQKQQLDSERAALEETKQRVRQYAADTRANEQRVKEVAAQLRSRSNSTNTTNSGLLTQPPSNQLAPPSGSSTRLPDPPTINVAPAESGDSVRQQNIRSLEEMRSHLLAHQQSLNAAISQFEEQQKAFKAEVERGLEAKVREEEAEMKNKRAAFEADLERLQVELNREAMENYAAQKANLENQIDVYKAERFEVIEQARRQLEIDREAFESDRRLLVAQNQELKESLRKATSSADDSIRTAKSEIDMWRDEKKKQVEEEFARLAAERNEFETQKLALDAEIQDLKDQLSALTGGMNGDGTSFDKQEYEEQRRFYNEELKAFEEAKKKFLEDATALEVKGRELEANNETNRSLILQTRMQLNTERTALENARLEFQQEKEKFELAKSSWTSEKFVLSESQLEKTMKEFAAEHSDAIESAVSDDSPIKKWIEKMETAKAALEATKESFYELLNNSKSNDSNASESISAPDSTSSEASPTAARLSQVRALLVAERDQIKLEKEIFQVKVEEVQKAMREEKRKFEIDRAEASRRLSEFQNRLKLEREAFAEEREIFTTKVAAIRQKLIEEREAFLEHKREAEATEESLQDRLEREEQQRIQDDERIRQEVEMRWQREYSLRMRLEGDSKQRLEELLERKKLVEERLGEIQNSLRFMEGEEARLEEIQAEAKRQQERLKAIEKEREKAIEKLKKEEEQRRQLELKRQEEEIKWEEKMKRYAEEVKKRQEERQRRRAEREKRELERAKKEEERQQRRAEKAQRLLEEKQEQESASKELDEQRKAERAAKKASLLAEKHRRRLEKRATLAISSSSKQYEESSLSGSVASSPNKKRATLKKSSSTSYHHSPQFGRMPPPARPGAREDDLNAHSSDEEDSIDESESGWEVRDAGVGFGIGGRLALRKSMAASHGQRSSGDTEEDTYDEDESHTESTYAISRSMHAFMNSLTAQKRKRKLGTVHLTKKPQKLSLDQLFPPAYGGKKFNYRLGVEVLNEGWLVARYNKIGSYFVYNIDENAGVDALHTVNHSIVCKAVSISRPFVVSYHSNEREDVLVLYNLETKRQKVHPLWKETDKEKPSKVLLFSSPTRIILVTPVAVYTLPFLGVTDPTALIELPIKGVVRNPLSNLSKLVGDRLLLCETGHFQFWDLEGQPMDKNKANSYLLTQCDQEMVVAAESNFIHVYQLVAGYSDSTTIPIEVPVSAMTVSDNYLVCADFDMRITIYGLVSGAVFNVITSVSPTEAMLSPRSQRALRDQFQDRISSLVIEGEMILSASPHGLEGWHLFEADQTVPMLSILSDVPVLTALMTSKRFLCVGKDKHVSNDKKEDVEVEHRTLYSWPRSIFQSKKVSRTMKARGGKTRLGLGGIVWAPPTDGGETSEVSRV